MGDWSEYFEDFPEENPANWIDGRFDPERAKRHYQQQRALEKAQKEANAELNKLINDAKEKTRRDHCSLLKIALNADCIL